MTEETANKQQKQGMHGCLKGCLVFLGLCVLAFVVIVGFLYYKRDDVKKWIVGKTFRAIEAGFVNSLPESVDKGKVTETLTRLKQSITDKELSRQDMEKILAEFQKVMGDGKLEPDEVEYLLRTIDEILKEKAAEKKIPAAFITPFGINSFRA